LEALSYISKKEKWEEVFTYDPGLKQLLSHSGIKVEDEEHEFENLRIGATRCEVLLARTGTILTSSLQGPGRRINTWPEIHLVFAEIHQLLPDLKEGIDYITNKYSKDKLPSDIKFISGPSRTADIEKTLVMGAHGPREIYVFLVDNQ
jgi:L-lactate dehydrogenase complex protein LldG